MFAYSELRNVLANAYPNYDSWRTAAIDSGIDPERISLQGAALDVWTNILRELRDRGRFAGLRAVLEAESPALLGHFDRYAAAIANGEADLPDFPLLESIEPTESDLQGLDKSLDLAVTLPIALLERALATSPDTTPESLDSLLSGGNTADAKMRLAIAKQKRAGEIQNLQNRSNNASNQIASLKPKISMIESAQPPSKPIVPNTANLPTETGARQLQWYYREQERHETELAKYNQDRAKLPSLLAELAGAERAVSELAGDIAAARAQAQAEEGVLRGNVADARDRDLLLELNGCTRRAREAFAGAAPFRGFWTLLGASVLLDFLRLAFRQPGVASRAEQDVARCAEELANQVEAEMPTIARGCLATTAAAVVALRKNKAALDDLLQRLSKLPIAELGAGTLRARKLESAELPDIPAYEHLERVEDIGPVKTQLAEMRAFTTAHAESVRKEIEAEVAARGEELAAAQSDAQSTIAAIKSTADWNSSLLGRTRMLWQLIARAHGSGNLPQLTRRLSKGLQGEAARRVGMAVDSLILTAEASNFGLEDAKAELEKHPMTAYAETQSKLTRHLEATKECSAALDKAIVTVSNLTGDVAKRYRSRLTLAAILAALPVVGLGASIWGVTLARALKPLVRSEDDAYVALGRFALRTLTLTSVITAIVAGAATASTLLFFDDSLLDMSTGTALASMALVSVATFLVTVRNAWVIRPFVRKV